MAQDLLPEVFTVREVALAAGVHERTVIALIDAGQVSPLPAAGRVRYLSYAEAVRAGRLVAGGLAVADLPLTEAPGDGTHAVGGVAHEPTLFGAVAREPRPRTPFAISSAAHGAALALAVFATIGMGSAAPVAISTRPDTRLVYLVVPGPGGGGGGGGARKPAPAPKAKKPGRRAISSPILSRPLPAAAPSLPKQEPPTQPVEAPVVSAPADDEERTGVLEDVPAPPDSEGPGSGGGAGAGADGGIGNGDGPGLGEGQGGGTGGGPYRPGSGIVPPTIVREVKPLYTEAARHRGLQGDVLLEIVVRRDGSVGDVRILQGLGHGLDARAAEAVRQWQFRPARRFGEPVDVLVEVAMEFRLR